MGFCINCEGVMYSCGYSLWENFREEIAGASVEFLKNEYTTLLQNDVEHTYLKKEVSKSIEYLNENNCTTIRDFMYFFSNTSMLNLFIYYNISGVYSLLNKSDDETYYTVGNAIDILETICLVEPYIKDEAVKNILPHIKEVFEKSIERKKIITIY